MKPIAIFAFLALAVAVSAQAPFSLSETFMTKGKSWYTVGDIISTGNGYWAVDQVNGSAVEHWEYDNHFYNVHFLQRFADETPREYRIELLESDDGANYVCDSNVLEETTMVSTWEWLNLAWSNGNVTESKHSSVSCTGGYWEFTVAGEYLGLCVNEKYVPLYYARHSRGTLLEIEFFSYNEVEAPESWMAVPDLCLDLESTVPRAVM